MGDNAKGLREAIQHFIQNWSKKLADDREALSLGRLVEDRCQAESITCGKIRSCFPGLVHAWS